MKDVFLREMLMISAVHIYTNKAYTFYGTLWATDDTESKIMLQVSQKHLSAHISHCTRL